MPEPFAARNVFDRITEAVSPTRAERRYLARERLAIARDTTARADRTSGNRFAQPYGVSRTIRGGSVVERMAQGSGRDRGRNVFAHNVIAQSLLITETDYVVAEGFTLQMGTTTPAFNIEAESRFWDFMESADITGLRSGADLFRASWLEPRKDGDGLFVKLLIDGRPRLQYVPGDLIYNPFFGKPGNMIYDGIECDAVMRPVRFYIRSADEAGRIYPDPVEAADAIYLAHTVDPLAIRGTTVYDTIFEHLDQLDSYLDSVQKAAIMACIFGLIEKRANPAEMLGTLGLQQNARGIDQKAITLEGGMLKVIGPQDSVTQVTAQQPMNQTPDFIRALFRIICLAFNMPLEIGQKDLSQVNFSGGRIGLIGFYRNCRIKQEWLLSRCWRQVVSWWLDIERQRQRLGYPDAFKTPFPADYRTYELRGREYEANDRLAEAQADQLEIDTGTNSLQQIIASKGRDYQAIQKERAEHFAKCRSDHVPSVLSSLTRDAPVMAVAAGGGDMPSGIEQARTTVDAFGVGVRAGGITPQIEDEERLRNALQLPPLSKAARQAWADDGGVRKPITLVKPEDTATPPPAN